jgi:hypothetical protein
VDEVGELDGVPDEEHTQVVADEVPVAVLGVHLHREATRVAGGLGGVAAAGHGREPDRQLGLLAVLGEQLGPGELRGRLVPDLAGRREVPVGECSAGVHHPLRDALAVEVADLLQELVVLQRRRPTSAHRALVLVVVDRVALSVGQHRALVALGGALARNVGHGRSLPVVSSSR